MGRQLVAHTLGAEEAARKRIAQELHDDILQTLLAAQRALARGEKGDDEAMAQAREAISLAVRSLRRQVFELHPPALEHAGLPEAVRQVAEQQARLGGWTVHLDMDRRADASFRQVLFSLARELLTNAAKHSEAANVWLSLAHDGDVLRLDVSDDGIGFPPDRLDVALAAGHIGLASSRERVEALGGRFDVAAAPNSGTRVTVELPARRRADQGGARSAAGAAA